MQGQVPQCPAGVPPPSTKRIKVRVDMQKASGWRYTIAADDAASAPYVRPNDVIELPNPTPQSIIEFRLQGPAGQQLDFDTTDPIWIDENGCPTAASNAGGEVCIVDCTANRLRILDRNTSQADLHYRLRFIDANGNPESWDPIIRNGGGGP